jgi:deoxyribodipyrimidine photo-lyase
MIRTAVVWFRRDLRVHDHPALTAAVAEADVVVPLFVFDDLLLHGRWSAPNRLWFLRESVAALGEALAERGAPLRVIRGRAVGAVPAFVREAGAQALYLTRDATPYGRGRDRIVADALAGRGIAVHAKRGLYVHEPDEVRTADGGPFAVYSPFRRAWASRPRRDPLPAPDRIPGGGRSTAPTGLDRAPAAAAVPTLADLGLPGPTADPVLLPAPGEPAARARLARWLDAGIDAYADVRDRLDLAVTSRLSQDLRFGLLSPLEVVARADRPGEGARVFTSEVIWREFYAHVLWHHPRVVREEFLERLAALPWRTGPSADADFDAWRDGRTGYPVVDAAMRQLRASGFVHNRARMLAASFLTKDLLLDWRLGEAHFMAHLVDGDLASNNGGWQWAASVGTDPQPYFRIFNPVLQGRRFDPDGGFVRRWVPELARVPAARIHEPWTMTPDEQQAAGCRIGIDYPAPIVDHAAARERALAAYAAVRDR